MTGYITLAECNFYHSLAMTGLHASASPAERAQLRRGARRGTRNACEPGWSPVRSASRRCTCSWKPSARVSRGLGSKPSISTIAPSRPRAMRASLHVEAIACERAMLWWEQEGKADFASFYLERALQAWDIWGALAKLNQLARTHVGRVARSTRTTTTARSTTGTTSNTQALDVAAVVKASQAISGEIVLERLLATLMDIIVENAGAECGSLMLESAGRMLVQASKLLGDAPPGVMQAIPLADGPHLSEGIVNYVVRTRQHVVIDDATRRSRFRNDPHVQAHSPKSVLCAPIMHKGVLTGALYLENNLLTGAFTPDRLEAINILLSQIAVSIENATLYARAGAPDADDRGAPTSC